MRNKFYLFILLMGVTLLAGCGNNAAVMEPISELPTIIEEVTITQTEDKTEKVSVPIYYGNTTADGLLMEEVELKEVTPEALIQMLARKNIVSVDTKVRGFQVIEKEGEVIIDLNLSKEFKEYVGMMGTAGEYIVLAGLTNTFLDAFSGTSLVLNVNGMPLETGHNIYEEPFVKFPLSNEKIENTYQITEGKIEDEVFQVTYPQLAGMEDETRMNKWNAIIKEQAMGDYTKEGMVSYQVDYEVATQDVEILSIVLRGECSYENAAYPFRFAKTINIDMSNGNGKRLATYADTNGIAKALQEGTGYEILSENVTKEDFENYLKSEYLDDFAILLFDYDYDVNNRGLIPTGYSYIKNNRPVLIINVVHAMGDYVEIQMDNFINKE